MWSWRSGNQKWYAIRVMQTGLFHKPCVGLWLTYGSWQSVKLMCATCHWSRVQIQPIDFDINSTSLYTEFCWLSEDALSPRITVDESCFRLACQKLKFFCVGLHCPAQKCDHTWFHGLYYMHVCDGRIPTIGLICGSKSWNCRKTSLNVSARVKLDLFSKSKLFVDEEVCSSERFAMFVIR